MPLTRLTLRHFRNHAATRLEGTARFNVLIGENGAGKTNVLEALSLLSPGRGLRRAHPAEMAGRSGDGSFAVSAELEGGAVALGTGVTLAAAKAGLDHGATGFMACDWGDSGHHQQWPVTLHALGDAAQAAWAWRRRDQRWGLPKSVDPVEGWIIGS